MNNVTLYLLQMVVVVVLAVVTSSVTVYILTKNIVVEQDMPTEVVSTGAEPEAGDVAETVATEPVSTGSEVPPPISQRTQDITNQYFELEARRDAIYEEAQKYNTNDNEDFELPPEMQKELDEIETERERLMEEL